MDPTRTDPARRMEDAFELYLAWCGEDDPEPADAFLARHEAYRDLLEPMVRGDAAATPFENHGDTGDAPPVLGDFELTREIGRGGMGVVYLARQVSLGRTVAVKVLPAHLTLDPRSIARFKREASLAAKLRHPNIVPIYTVGSEDDTHYFAMQLVDGAPLDRVLKEIRDQAIDTFDGAVVGEIVARVAHRFPGRNQAEGDGEADRAAAPGFWSRSYIEVVVRIVAQVAEALDHAHRENVLHRDVKPANIMVRDDGTVLLADFGLAREQGLPSMTVTGEFAGTPSYVSPEQALGKHDKVDQRADIFSLGATLYELVTLHPPFEGDTIREILGNIISREPRDPRKLNANLSPDLAAIILKALEKDPDRRYATADDLAADLRAFLEYRPIAARRASLPRKVLRWSRREPLKAALVVVLALGIPALALLGGYLIATGDERRRGEEAMRTERLEGALMEAIVPTMTGAFEDGQTRFERILTESPDCFEALLGLIQIHLARKRHETALALLDEHANRGVRRDLLDRLRVTVLKAMGRNEEAAALMSTIPRARDPLAHWAEGNIRAGEADEGNDAVYQDALRSFRRAVLTQDSIRPLFLWNLGINASYAGDHATARDVAHTLEARWKDRWGASYWAALILYRSDRRAAIDCLQRAVTLQNGEGLRSNAAEQLASLLFDEGLYRESLEVSQRAIQRGRNTARIYTMASCAHRALGDYASAEVAVRNALKRDPRFEGAHGELALVLRLQNRGSEAIQVLEGAIRAGIDTAQVRTDLGQTLGQAGDFPRAEAEFREAIAMAPDSREAHLGLATALVNQRKSESAAACRANLARLGDENDLLIAQAGLLLVEGQEDSGTGSFIKAAQLLTRAREREPSDPGIVEALGLALSLQDRWKESEALCRAALADGVVDAMVHTALGRALAGQNRWSEAEAAFEEALRLDRGQAEHIEPHVNSQLKDLLEADATQETRQLCKWALSHGIDGRMIQTYLAWALVEEEEFDEAVSVMERAFAAAPDSEEVHLARIKILEIAAIRSPRIYGSLLAAHERWCETHADSARSWHRLGRALLDPELPEDWRSDRRALEAAKKSVALSNRKELPPLLLQAEALLAAERREEAKQVFDEAMRLAKSAKIRDPDWLQRLREVRERLRE